MMFPPVHSGIVQPRRAKNALKKLVEMSPNWNLNFIVCKSGNNETNCIDGKVYSSNTTQGGVYKK